MVTHLKLVKDDCHAIKNFDRELECKTCRFAKAAGVEAVIPSRSIPTSYDPSADCVSSSFHNLIHVQYT